MKKNRQTQRTFPEHQRQVAVAYLVFLGIINLPAFIKLLELFGSFRTSPEKIAMLTIWVFLFVGECRRKKLIYAPSHQVRYLLLAILFQLLGLLSGLSFFYWAGAAMSIYSFFNYFFGDQVSRRFIIPLLLMLYFAKLESPTAINIFLMQLRLSSAQIGAGLLQLAHLGGKVVQGTYIMMSDGSYCSVDMPCSGVNTLMSLTFLTLVLAYLKRSNILKTLLLWVAAGILAVLSNGLRIFLIAGAGYLFPRITSWGGIWLHDFFGVVTFVLALGAVVFLECQVKFED